MAGITIDDIKDIAGHHMPEPIGDWYSYSVLLPLVEKGGGLFVLYELRAKDLDVQPGEVSFPGGGIEEGETAFDAARRETMEELGLPAGAIEIVSEIDFLVSHGNIKLHCFLGIIDGEALEKADINKIEVSEYFLVPLEWLIQNEPDVYYNRIITEPAANLPVQKLDIGSDYNWRTGISAVPVYSWPDPELGEDRIIWGMTANLTRAFVELIRPQI